MRKQSMLALLISSLQITAMQPKHVTFNIEEKPEQKTRQIPNRNKKKKPDNNLNITIEHNIDIPTSTNTNQVDMYKQLLTTKTIAAYEYLNYLERLNYTWQSPEYQQQFDPKYALMRLSTYAHTILKDNQANSNCSNPNLTCLHRYMTISEVKVAMAMITFFKDKNDDTNIINLTKNLQQFVDDTMMKNIQPTPIISPFLMLAITEDEAATSAQQSTSTTTTQPSTHKRSLDTMKPITQGYHD